MNSPYKLVAATAVIVGNSVLLGKRISYYKGEKIPSGGYWSLFGGAVEKDESPFKAAERELYEETGIEISHPLLYVNSIFDKENAVKFMVYVAKLDSFPEIVLNYEHTEYGWFNINTLNSFVEKIDQKIVDSLNFYVKKLSN